MGKLFASVLLDSLRMTLLLFPYSIAFTNTSFDKFTQARALVAPMTLSDAILRKGTQLDGGLSAMLQNQTAMVDIVTDLYARSLLRPN